MGHWSVIRAILIIATWTSTIIIAEVQAGRCNVDILNDVYAPIVLQCRLGDNDLGVKRLVLRTTFHFDFNPNEFGTTLFYCVFNWGYRTQQIDVWSGDDYDDQLDCAKEGDCLWKVTTTGFYWTIQPDTDQFTWTFYKDFQPCKWLDWINNPSKSRKKACRVNGQSTLSSTLKFGVVLPQGD